MTVVKRVENRNSRQKKKKERKEKENREIVVHPFRTEAAIWFSQLTVQKFGSRVLRRAFKQLDSKVF